MVNEDEFTDDVYDETLPSGNPIRAAVDAFAEKLGAEESKESGSGIPTPLPQEDKRSNYHNFSLPQENLHNMASNIAEMASSYLEKEGIAELASSFLNAHIPGNSKPALRFVRHVTCPDGTLVPPSVPFCKTWRVRNDGKIAWPEGSVLVHSSGDQLTYEEPVALETLPGPGEEVDITVNLKCMYNIFQSFSFPITYLFITSDQLPDAPAVSFLTSACRPRRCLGSDSACGRT